MAHIRRPMQGSSFPKHLEACYSGSMFKDQSAFCSHLIQKISEARVSTNIIQLRLVYNDIDPSWIVETMDSLKQRKRWKCFKSYNPLIRTFVARTMPTDIHNSDQVWFYRCQYQWSISGLLTGNEVNALYPTSNTSYIFPNGPLAGEEKLPNMSIEVMNHPMPRIVFESGWSETFNELLEDVRQWLVGANGAVQAVILIKWTKSSTTPAVRGLVELWVLGRDGMPHLQQTEQIFPRPTGIAQQTIRLTRRMILGSNMDPGRDPRDIFGLDVDTLRGIAQRQLQKMNLVPA